MTGFLGHQLSLVCGGHPLHDQGPFTFDNNSPIYDFKGTMAISHGRMTMKMKLAISHGRMMCRKNMKMEINKMKNNFLIWTQSEAVGWTLTGGHWGGGRSTSLQNNIKHYKSIHSVVSIMLVFVSLGMCFFLYFFLRCLHDACSTLKFESLI
jgi:hypothetical protein